MEGIITYWNQSKKFGFAVVKQTDGWLKTYFILASNLVRKETEPAIDVPVVFDGTVESRKPGGYPVALNVQILRPASSPDAGSTLNEVGNEPHS